MKQLGIIIFFIASSALAQDHAFFFKHPTCQVRIKNNVDKDLEYLYEELKFQLKEKGFRITYFIENKKLFEKEMYIKLHVHRPKTKLWRDCIVRVDLKEAKGRLPLDTDKVLYTKEVKRALPRVTFYGKERCARALKDAFIHIPYCKKSR